MSRAIRVGIADDHELFREGIRLLLSKDERLAVVGEAGDGAGAVELATSAKPDVMLLDVEMPGPPVYATMARVLRACPNTRVVILTMHRDAILRRELLQAGAAAYLTKMTPSRELIATIRALVADSYDEPHRLAPHRPTVDSADILSDREIQVVTLIAAAMTNNAIAENLSISVGTVKRHAGSIYKKLGAASRMDAVIRAKRLGILTA